MRKTWLSIGVLIALVTGSTNGSAADILRLALPVDCQKATQCDVIKYFDHDPGPGLQDYACGRINGGENNYPGTSIAIRDQVEMNQGVPVLAAAAGMVLRTRDEMQDTGVFGTETREDLGAKGCGNAVVLDHGDGWTTVYCHLRRNSVRVKPGDKIETGRIIGLVGLSGLTELPHLHFQVRHHNQPIDPFTGTAADSNDRQPRCSVSEHPLWTTEALAVLTPYKPVFVRLMGFTTEETSVKAVRRGGADVSAPSVLAPRLILWAEIIGPRQGDRVILSAKAPNGQEILHQSGDFHRDYSQSFLQARAERAVPTWPVGAYQGRVEILRDGRSFVRELTLNLH
ncbi:Peptidase family M23 [Azospirillaceae bacterium]